MAGGQVDYDFLTAFAPKIIDVTDRAGEFWVRQRYVIERDRSELHVIAYIRSGLGYVRLDDGPQVQLRPGSVFHIGTERKMYIETTPRRPLAFYSIHFRFGFVDWRGANAELRPVAVPDLPFPTVVLRAEDASLEDEFRQTLVTWEGKAPGYEWHAKLGLLSAFRRICQLLDRPRADESEDATAIKLAVEYIKTHLHLPLDRADVAAMVGLSPGYFSTLFKKRTGHGFAQYVRRLRVDEAKRFLRETDLQVQEVAARVGFADPFYFSRVFRDAVGMPPQHYRAT